MSDANYLDVIGRDIAYQCRAMRGQRGWTQQELAERAGINVATVGRVEGGGFFGDVSTLTKIASAFDVAVIARFVPSPPPPPIPAPFGMDVFPDEEVGRE